MGRRQRTPRGKHAEIAKLRERVDDLEVRIKRLEDVTEGPAHQPAPKETDRGVDAHAVLEEMARGRRVARTE